MKAWLAVLITTLVLSACVYRPRDERVVIVETKPPQGAEDASKMVGDFFRITPSKDTRGYTWGELISVLNNNWTFWASEMGDPCSSKELAEFLMKFDRNNDSFLSPEELVKGLSHRTPLVRAMRASGKSDMNATDLEVYFAETHPGATETLWTQLVTFVLRYDKPQFGGNGDGRIGMQEALTPSFALYAAGRLSIKEIESALALMVKMKPTEQVFLAKVLDYKVRGEGLNTGKMSGWGKSSYFGDEYVQSADQKALIALSLMRLHQIDYLVAQKSEDHVLTDPFAGVLGEIFQEFYKDAKVLPTEYEWNRFVKLYDFKTLDEKKSAYVKLSSFEVYLMMSDVEMGHRLYAGVYNDSFYNGEALRHLFKSTFNCCQVPISSWNGMVEYLTARELTDYFFKQYDNQRMNKSGVVEKVPDMLLDREEFRKGVTDWGLASSHYSTLLGWFFKYDRKTDKPEQEIDASKFFERGWGKLRPYLLDL